MTPYSVGYARSTHADIRRLINTLHIDRLVDVRAVPYSRRPGFSRAELQAAFPEYLWKGDILGGIRDGINHTSPAGIAWLATQAGKETVLLMCVEPLPENCHRRDIAEQLFKLHGIDAHHIYGDRYALASELMAAIAEDRVCELIPL